MEFIDQAISQLDAKVVLSMIGISLVILIGVGRGDRNQRNR